MTRTRRDGYVLVLTLVLITIAALLLSGLARHSLRGAVSTLEEKRRLQTKWGMASIETIALNQPSYVLTERVPAADGAPGFDARPVASRQARIALGGIDFTWELNDEQSKINVNLWAANRSKSDLERLVHRHAPADSSVRLAPYDRETATAARVEFQSLGQLLDLSANRDREATARQVWRMSRLVSCWGDGATLNVHTAHPDALREVVSLATTNGTAEELIALRESDRSLSLSKMMDQLQLRLRERELLERLLVERSRAWSVWVRAEMPHGTGYRMVVKERVGNAGTKSFVFTW